MWEKFFHHIGNSQDSKVGGNVDELYPNVRMRDISGRGLKCWAFEECKNINNKTVPVSLNEQSNWKDVSQKTYKWPTIALSLLNVTKHHEIQLKTTSRCHFTLEWLLSKGKLILRADDGDDLLHTVGISLGYCKQ